MPSRLISVIGTLNVDSYMITERVPQPGESVRVQSYTSAPGGKGSNAAVATFRSCHVKPPAAQPPTGPTFHQAYKDDVDIHVTLVGAVGDDDHGRTCVANLRRNGVDAAAVAVAPHASTGVSFCVVEAATGESRVMSYRGANWAHRPGDFVDAAALAGGVTPDLLVTHLTLPRDTVEQILTTAGAHGVEILLNAAPAQPILAPYYRFLTHLIVNETEAAILSGVPRNAVGEDTWASIAGDFQRQGVQNVVVTLGARGAYYATADGQTGHVDALKVDVVDSTGAGDTFVGYYAAEYVRQRAQGQWDIRRAVERACRASAKTISQAGAQAAIPWADEIDGSAFTTGRSIKTL